MSTAAHNAANIVRTMKSYMSGIGYVWLGARVGRCLNTIIRLAIWLWVNRCALLVGHSVNRLLVRALSKCYYLHYHGPNSQMCDVYKSSGERNVQ